LLVHAFVFFMCMILQRAQQKAKATKKKVVIAGSVVVAGSLAAIVIAK